MNAGVFEAMYEDARPKAVRVIVGRYKNTALAEDAVQAAALYFLERLDRYAHVTPSLFVHVAMNRASDLTRRGGRRGYPPREQGVGGGMELERVEALYPTSGGGRVSRHLPAE